MATLDLRPVGQSVESTKGLIILGSHKRVPQERGLLLKRQSLAEENRYMELLAQESGGLGCLVNLSGVLAHLSIKIRMLSGLSEMM